ncbi:MULTISPECIES: hypothetical protein [Vibrio]|uniref:YdcF family protein n=1 Tax=Vibrio rotiferianus TaxID=190895 RepID=A0A7Y3Z6T5_9VIBR|nr:MULTISPECIES: hypothetical protein [Vibrio]MDK9776040.1 hypothetical protein [Vibrio sp. D401a]MDK9805936.1 hypothetical protein [Vibrio sp. D406a]NOH47332.1 YdcF family protein [Vibrio rotiferianus]
MSETPPYHEPFEHKSRYQLEDLARKRIQNYVASTVLKRRSFGKIQESKAIVAFSFGDSAEVNKDLAELISSEVSGFDIPLYLQQEIASHMPESEHIAIENQSYQTTKDVAAVVLKNIGEQSVTVVAQAFHAQRCIDTCNEIGLDVVALRVVNRFPSNDPQPWVRSEVNWIIKESHRDTYTGYEISDKYKLS